MLQVNLIICRYSIYRQELKFVLDQGSIPAVTFQFGRDNINSCLSQILYDYLNTEPSWLKLRLIDVLDVDGGVSLFYAVLVPSDLKLLRGREVSFYEVDEESIRKVFYAAGQKVF